MRTTILVLVLAAAVAGAAYLLIGDEDGPGTGPVGGGGEAVDEHLGPQLTGFERAARPARMDPAVRGAGAIVGTVVRGETPVAASVELRQVSAIDISDVTSLLSALSTSFVERVLDGGMAAGPPAATAAAGEDGTFVFAGVAAGIYEVRATDAERRQGIVAAMVPASGARVEVTVTLPNGDVTLRGRVEFADGSPFQGTVVLQPAGEFFNPFMPAAGTPAETDAEGQFAIGGLVPGMVALSAIRPGSLRAIGSPFSLPHADTYVLTIGAEGAELRGRVIAAETKEPVSNASVIAGSGNPSSGFLLRRTTTDAAGRFTIQIAQGRGGCIVQAPGFALAMTQLRGAPDDEIVIQLVRLGHLEGQVTAKGTQQAVGGLAVHASPMEAREGFALPASVAANASGHYRLEAVTPGTNKVFALGPGWVTPGTGLDDPGGYNPLAAEVRPGETTRFDIEVVPAGTVRGRVLTSEGQPVVGCLVSARRVSNSRPDFLLMPMLGGLAPDMDVTTANGSYRIRTLLPDTEYTLEVRAVGHPPSQSDPFRVASASEHELDVRLAAARWLQLTAVSSAGQAPVPSARVQVGYRTGDKGDWQRVRPVGWTTGAEGRAKIGPLPPGRIAVTIQAPGHQDLTDWHELEASSAGGTSFESRVTLEKGYVVAGRVRPPEGASLGGVEVTIRRPHGYRGGRWVWERPPVQQDGSFRADTLPDGPYGVTADLTWKGRAYRANTEAEAGDDALELVLEEVSAQDGQLQVTVVDADGNAVPTGRINLKQVSENSSSSSGNRLGRGPVAFDLGRWDDEEGDLWIEVYDVPDGRSGAAVVALSGNESELTIRLPPARTITGRVTTEGGKGVRGVRVVAEARIPGTPGTPGHDGETHASAHTDEDGRYALEGLGDLTYRLAFYAPPAFEPPEALLVTAPATGTDVTLQIGAAATITVLDYRGQPVPGARVTAGESQPSSAMGGRPPPVGPERALVSTPGAATNADGIARLEGLPRGRAYTLDVAPPEKREDLLPHDQPNWSPRDETIRLRQAYSIRGIVRDKQGKPVSGARVGYMRADAQVQQLSVSTRTDGRFTVPRLEAGEYEVFCWLHDSPSSRTQPEKTTVRAGAGSVSLTLDVGRSLQVRVKGWQKFAMWAGAQLVDESTGDTARTNPNEGRMTFRGLSADRTYTLAITSMADGRYVYRTGLQPREGWIEVEPEEGRTISGRVTLPAGRQVERIYVHVRGPGFQLGAPAKKDGTFEVTGIPRGTWKTAANAADETTQFYGEVEVSTGESVEIRLEARPRRR